MEQDVTGSASAETTESTEMTDERRDELAAQIVDRFSLYSGAAGLIPVPLVDVATVGGVQLQMLRKLSEIYSVPFTENRGKSIIASLAGALIPASGATSTAMGVGSLLKSLPGIGTLAAAQPTWFGLVHLVTGTGGTSGSVTASRRFEKSRASARFFALASRIVIGSRPQRHSIIRRTEQCS